MGVELHAGLLEPLVLGVHVEYVEREVASRVELVRALDSGAVELPER